MAANRKKGSKDKGFMPRSDAQKKAIASRKSEKDAKKKTAADRTQKVRERREAAREKAAAQPQDSKPIEPKLESDGAFRSGYVALVGRPNVGKSTILNRLLGQKVAATTHKPQTTRTNLLGMLNPEGAQILILDTPGYHAAKGALNRFMVQQAEDAIGDADVVAYVVEARGDRRITPGNERLIDLLVKTKNKPIVLLINKVDTVKPKSKLLLQIERYQEVLKEQLVAVVPMSAKQKVGLEAAVREMGLALPEGPQYFDPDAIVDASEQSIAAEFIREKLMLETKEELPYAAAVTIEAFQDERPKIVRIYATIHVERESQKSIVIGKGGSRLKEIGTRARGEIETLLGSKVFLGIDVRVSSRWTANKKSLAELGYSATAEQRPGAAKD